MATMNDPVPGGSEQLTPSTTEQPVQTGIQPAPGEPGPGEPGPGEPGPVRAGSDADPGRIPLPPIPAPPAEVSPRVRARARFLDGILFLLLLVFAFLCASFTATNWDLFLHLATGRLISQGEYTFGSDPFTFSAQGTWVNQSWLFDLIAYFIYSIPQIGGVVLVVAKAVVVVLTAWLMLQVGSLPGRSRWIPLACAFLAVLALSPRLFLQPPVLSMLFLALTLYLLLRPSGRSIWLVPVVCLFWVNLDAWFFLGPATVLLFTVGEFLQLRQQGETGTPDAIPPKQLVGVLLASVAACLVNPYHVYAFTALPTGLLRPASLEVLAREPIFRAYFFSPILDAKAYLVPWFGLSAAGIAYYVLLGVSLVSFIVTAVWNLDGLRWWRVLVWLGFALLSVWNLRAIPYFAVVAAPITALNFLDLSARLFGPDLRPQIGWQRWAIAGRLLTVFIALVGVLLCVPGRLQSQPYYRRAVDWGVKADPGLKQAALEIERWRQEGLIEPGQHWFNLSPEVVGYLAWFCPGEKGFIDQRLELYAPVGRDFAAIRRSLGGEEPPGERDTGAADPWVRLFTEHDVRFVIYHSDPSRFGVSLHMMYANPDEFVPCFVQGGTAIFAWRHPRKSRARPVNPQLTPDFQAQAFGPEAVTAPEQPKRAPGTLPWWQQVLHPDNPTPTSAGTGAQHRVRFDALSARFQKKHSESFLNAVSAALPGMIAVPGGPVAGGLLPQLRMAMTYNPNQAPNSRFSPIDDAAVFRAEAYMRTQDLGPVASLYLAIRECRRGLSEMPDDEVAQQILAESYVRLRSATKEFSRTTFLGMARRADTRQRQEIVYFPHAKMIRLTQAAAALRNVLKVNAAPDQQQLAHLQLAELFKDPEYLELRVHHLKEFLKLVEEHRGIAASLARQREMLKNFEQEVKNEERKLKSNQDLYLTRSANKPLLEKVQIALSFGLRDTALKLLSAADPKERYDRRNPQLDTGGQLAVLLMLSMGQISDALEVLTPDPTSDKPPNKRRFGIHMQLGLPAYEWFRAQAAAATGNYDEADEYLAECIEMLEKSRTYSEMLVQLDVLPARFAEREMDRAAFAAYLVGDTLLREAPQGAGMPWQWWRVIPYRLHPNHQPRLPGAGITVRQGRDFLLHVQSNLADLWTVRAWLALEAGWIAKAQEYAQKALDLADLGVTEGGRIRASFRSAPLAQLVLERTAKQ